MKRHALFVGVNNYMDKDIRNLRYSIPDAAVLADRFKGFGYKTRLLSDPTSAELRAAVLDSIDGLGRGDVFLFFFAGHGFTAQDGSHLLFCRDDIQKLLRVGNAGVKVDALEMLTCEGGFHRAFFLDSCRTDCFTGVENRGNEETRDLDFVKIPEPTDETGSYYLLRSCDKFRPSLEIKELGHGLFTQGLLDAIDARDRRLGGCNTDFATAVSVKMADRQKQYNVDISQRPSIGESSGSVFSLFDDEFFSDIEKSDLSTMQSSPRVSTLPAAAIPTYVVCPICGKNNLITETFNCRKCNTDYLCLSHKSSEVGLCEKCHSSSVVSVVPESRDIKNVKCADIPVQTFKNATVHPECHLFDEELDYALVKGKDYVVQYEDADSPGFATAVITGIGKYRGERRVLFEIKKEDVQEPLPLKKILCNQFKDYIGVYDGKAHSVSPSDDALADASGFKYTWYNKNTGRWDIEFPKYVDVCDVSLRIKIEATGYLPRIECRRIKIARRDLADSMVKKAAVVRSATGELLPDILLKDRRPCVIRRDDWEVLECDENHIVINGKRNYSGELDVRLRGEERNDIGNGEMEIVPLKPSELGSNVSSLCCNIDSVDEIEEKRECKNLWPLVFFWIVGILVVQGGLMMVGIIVYLLIGLFVESVLGISHTDYPERELFLWCGFIVPTIVTVLGALLLGLGFLGLRENKKN